MVKIRTQIEDTLSNRKLTETEKLDIVERAQEKFVKLKDSMRPTKTPIVVHGGNAPASIDLTPSESPMFQGVNLPAIARRGSRSFSSSKRRTRTPSRSPSRRSWFSNGRLSTDQNFMT